MKGAGFVQGPYLWIGLLLAVLFLILLWMQKKRAGLRVGESDFSPAYVTQSDISNEVFAGIVKSISPGIVLVDAQGEIIWANQSFQELMAGENLAGAPTVERAHSGLMNSPGHRANILNPNFTHVGIGIVDGGPYGKMYTQTFIGIK